MSMVSTQNDNCIISTYLKAYKSCYRQMVQVLPIDHFIIDLVEKDQLPSGLKSRIQAKETREMRVQCLLDEMEGEIQVGCPQRFIQLLQTIKKYAIRENCSVIKKLAEDTLSKFPDMVVKTRDFGVQCDILPAPIQPNYSVMIIGVIGCGKSAACNFFFQNEVFESNSNFFPVTKVSSPQTAVIANYLVTIIDTPGFVYDLSHLEDHVIKEIVRGTQLASEGVHAVALVINCTTRIDYAEKKIIESLMENSWLMSSTFVLFTHGTWVGKNDDEQRQWLKKLLQDSDLCPDILKNLMKQVKQRFIMLESVEPMGTNYHNSKSLELIAMIKNIYDHNNHRLLTKDDFVTKAYPSGSKITVHHGSCSVT